MRPIRIEVITYAPTFFYHCQHCELTFREVGVGAAVHRSQAREALPADLQLEYEILASWAHGLLERHGRAVRVRLVDAASIEGFWKSLRYRLRRYPAVIIEGTERYVGLDLRPVDAALRRRLDSAVREEGP
jgi:hypothetical protein